MKDSVYTSRGLYCYTTRFVSILFFFVLQLNWTILRNVSAMSTTMSETWKAQRSSLKISLTTDDGDEVSTEGEAKGRFVS